MLVYLCVLLAFFLFRKKVFVCVFICVCVFVCEPVCVCVSLCESVCVWVCVYQRVQQGDVRDCILTTFCVIAFRIRWHLLISIGGSVSQHSNANVEACEKGFTKMIITYRDNASLHHTSAWQEHNQQQKLMPLMLALLTFEEVSRSVETVKVLIT